MIIGLQVEVPSAELLAHLTTRCEFHRRTEAIYRKQLAETEEIQHEVSEQFFQKGGATGIRDRIKAAVDHHAGRAAYFDLLAKHLIPNETYRLHESDLRSVEML